MADAVSVRVGTAALLAGVSLAVPPGRITAIVGPNGAGKSTLLHALAGGDRLTGGEVRLDGRPLRQWARVDLARRRAVLLQRSALDFAFTSLEVVLLGRAPHGGRATRGRDLAIATAALAAADAAHLRDRVYPTLSGGERQRVHLARVLAQVWEPQGDAPSYLLLDEPTAALDLAHQHRALAAVRAWTGVGGGALIVLHDLNLAAAYADQVLVLRAGRAVTCAAPDRALHPDVVERAFGVCVERIADNGRWLLAVRCE